MVCKNCGTIFEEGLFCPECGTKNEVNTSEIQNDEMGKEYQKAYNILNEYENVEEEKSLISNLGWPYPENIEDRIRVRLEIYQKATMLDIKTVGAKQMISKMRDDIKNDYYAYKEKDSSLGAQIFWAIVFTLLAINFLFPLGIIGIIIGIIIICAGWGAVNDVRKHKKTLEELEIILRQID